MTDISIIIPVYNAIEYLKPCIESIAESCRNASCKCEIIFVDDGSTDGSGAECETISERFCSVDSICSIAIIHQRNMGQAAARNRGVEIATGKWISFVDSDDYVHPQFLRFLYKAAVENDAGISMCNAVFNAGDNPDSFKHCQKENVTVITIDEDFFINLYSAPWQEQGYKNETIWGKLYRRDIVQKKPFPEGHFCEDSAIMCSWFKDAGKVVDCPVQLYYYRDNPSGTMNTFNEKKRFDKLWSLLEMRRFYSDNGYAVMREKTEKEFLWLIISYERDFPDNTEYLKIRKKLFLQWVWFWNISLKGKLGSFKEYYFIGV